MSGFAGIAPAVQKLAAAGTPGGPESTVLGPPAPKPTLTTVPTAPPEPVFQRRGAKGRAGSRPHEFNQRLEQFTQTHLALTGVAPKPEFNQRLEQFTQTHLALTGVAPKPDVALQAVFTPGPVVPPQKPLPSIGIQPSPFAQAQASPAANALLLHPVLPTPEFVQGLSDAAKGGEDSYNQFVVANSPRIAALQDDPAWKGRVNAIVNDAVGTFHPAGAAAEGPQAYHAITPQEATFFSFANAHTPLLLQAASQIVKGLVFSPLGFASAVSAVGSDLGAANVAAERAVGIPTRPTQTGNFSFQHTQALAHQVGHGFAQDFRDPRANPGYLFLDVLGLVSFGAGSGARTAAALGKLGEEGSLAARVGEAGRAFAEKPTPQRLPIRAGGVTEHMLLSSNPLVAEVQRMIVGIRQSVTDARDLGELPVLPVPGLTKKVGREARARWTVEHNAMMAPAEELRAAAGSSASAANVWAKLPRQAKRGLSRGEQKAIFAASWDVPGTIEDKIAAEVKFHHDAIAGGIGDAKAHQRHIADLVLARAAAANPSPRFAHSLDLTRALMADNDRLRTQELGLAPLTAEGRIAKAGQILRGEEAVGGPRTAEDSFYLPTQPRGKVKRGYSQAKGHFVPQVGPTGMSLPRDLPELNHTFTGNAMLAGNIRMDATNLAYETYARTVRAISVKNRHDELFDAAHPTKMSEWDIPIRDSKAIPDKLREITSRFDEGQITQREVDLLPEDMRDLIRELYPDERDLAKLTPEEIEHVRYIDARLIGGTKINNRIYLDTGMVPPWWMRTEQVLNAVNTPIRFTTLYLRPAYALNLLGNHAMLWFDQGFTTSLQNVARALNLKNSDGEANTALIHRLVGAGRSRSYEANFAGKGTRAVANFWNNFADRDERAASWIYYADRLGYKTPEARDRLLHSDDQKIKDDRTEITRRANKALVEFDNLSPIEKNVIRHFIFVYPWVRGATVWSLRAIFEHPAKTAILANLAQEAIQHDQWLKNAPTWFKRTGYVPVGFDHNGDPMMINPTSINTPTTLADIYDTIDAAATKQGNAASAAEDLLGPFGKFAIHAATGRDQYGNKYPDGAWLGAAKDALTGLPQAGPLGIATAAKTTPLKQFKITDRKSLEARANSYAHQPVFGPGWLWGYGSLFAGGLSPKALHPTVLGAKGVAELTPAERVQREVRFLNQALTLQGEFLGQSVPPGLRTNLRAGALVTRQGQVFQKQTGRAMTEKERLGAWIDTLAKLGSIPPADAAVLHKELHGTNTDGMAAFKKKLMTTYASANELSKWDNDVRALYSFKKSTFNEKASDLFAHGLSPQRTYANTSQADLFEYGRGYVAYREHVKAMRADKASAAEIRAYTDEHSVPVKGLPSYAAIDFANRTPADQARTIVRDNYTSWSSLSAVEKRLVGRPVSPDVTVAWNAYSTLAKQVLAKEPVGARSLAKNQREFLVKYVDRYYGLHGAFLRDYLFSKEPLYQRLPYLNLVKDSPNRAEWHDLLSRVKTMRDWATNKQTTVSAARDTWHDYAAELEAYYKTNDPKFWSELGPILEQHPGFLRDLFN